MRSLMDNLLSLRAILFLAVLFFSTSALASPAPNVNGASSLKIISRQVQQSEAVAITPGTQLSTPDACAQYSRVANLSAIGTNSSIRSAFLAASPVGTLFNAAMLNVMQADAVALTKDVQLNEACGNLTTIALEAVGVNFTMGIVGQFTFTGNPTSVVNGPIIVVLTVLCLMILLGPASAM
ncbi:unnamed protein product [Discula destructiva]